MKKFTLTEEQLSQHVHKLNDLKGIGSGVPIRHDCVLLGGSGKINC